MQNHKKTKSKGIINCKPNTKRILNSPLKTTTTNMRSKKNIVSPHKGKGNKPQVNIVSLITNNENLQENYEVLIDSNVFDNLPRSRKQSPTIMIKEKCLIDYNICDPKVYIKECDGENETAYRLKINKLEAENDKLVEILTEKEMESKSIKKKDDENNFHDQIKNFAKSFNEKLEALESLCSNFSKCSKPNGYDESLQSNSSNSSLITIANFETKQGKQKKLKKKASLKSRKISKVKTIQSSRKNIHKNNKRSVKSIHKV